VFLLIQHSKISDLQNEIDKLNQHNEWNSNRIKEAQVNHALLLKFFYLTKKRVFEHDEYVIDRPIKIVEADKKVTKKKGKK
jgi:hypothetical protein